MKHHLHDSVFNVDLKIAILGLPLSAASSCKRLLTWHTKLLGEWNDGGQKCIDWSTSEEKSKTELQEIWPRLMMKAIHVRARAELPTEYVDC